MINFSLKNNTIIGNKNGVLLPAPRKNRPNKKERHWLVRCNFCNESRWLKMYDLKKDVPCRACSATISSSTSSELEDSIANFMSDMGIEYERHVPLITEEVRYNVDFFLPMYDLYVEVVGYWHTVSKYIKDHVLRKLYNVVFVETLDEVREVLSAITKR